MKVAAVVVRWRGGAEVERCLDSLHDQRGGRLDRIILVDSGSGDGGAERLAAAYPDIEVLALPDNRSFAHAANRGVVEADADSVLLLNPDTELEPGAVDILADTLDARPRCAGVVPLLVNPDGTSQHRWQLRRLPNAARLALGMSGAPAFGQPPRIIAGVEQPAAAAWLVRREVWRQLGGLDERFAPAWWEDVDFCARLAGVAADPAFPATEGFLVVPAAIVRHLGGSSVGEIGSGRVAALFAVNLVRYAERHHPDRLAVIRTSLGASLIARAALRPARAADYLAARRAVMRRTPP